VRDEKIAQPAASVSAKGQKLTSRVQPADGTNGLESPDLIVLLLCAAVLLGAECWLRVPL
jgi:hypothetical protein